MMSFPAWLSHVPSTEVSVRRRGAFVWMRVFIRGRSLSGSLCKEGVSVKRGFLLGGASVRRGPL